ELSRALDRFHGKIERFAASLIEFVFEVNVAGGKESMDARPRGSFEGLPASIDICGNGASETGDGSRADLGRNLLHGLEITFRGDRESSFNDVHLKPLELTRHLQLLFH